MAETELLVIFKGEDESLSRTAESAGGIFGRLGSAAKVGLAVGVTAIATMGAAAVDLGVKLVGLGSSAEEMMGKFNVVFANTGGQVIGELDAFGAAVGRSRFELREMAATFGDTFKPLGFAEQAAADLSVQMVKLATDLGSFNDMEMDEALQRLQSTLIGNHENALAFGVIINENTLKAELAAQGWDKLTGSALEQAKVQARINLLMAGTTDAQGDAERTSGSWANQMRALQATLKDVGTELGLKLLPQVTPLLSQFREMAIASVPQVTEAFENLLPAIEKGVVFAGMLIEHLPAVIDFFIRWGPAIAAVVGVLTALSGAVVVIGFIGSLISAVGTAVAAFSAILPIIGAVVAVLTGPLGLAIAAAIAVVALFTAAWRGNWFGIRDTVMGVVDWIGGAIFKMTVWFRNELPGAIANTVDWFRNVWDWVNRVGEAISRITWPIRDAIGWLNNLAGTLGRISLPDWMRPGSPTPWELGLRGVAAALQEVNSVGMRGLDANLARANSTYHQVQTSNVYNIYAGQPGDRQRLRQAGDLAAARAILGGI